MAEGQATETHSSEPLGTGQTGTTDRLLALAWWVAPPDI